MAIKIVLAWTFAVIKTNSRKYMVNRNRISKSFLTDDVRITRLK
jgi:hypothetical protein